MLTSRSRKALGFIVFAIGLAVELRYFNTSNVLRLAGVAICMAGAVIVAGRVLHRIPDAPCSSPTNAQLPWFTIGGLLVAAGVIGIAAHILPKEVDLASVLVGGACVTFALQRKGVKLPKVPSWIVWMVITILLVAFFYFTRTPRH